ncbi:hypothetical protein V6M85_13850 [Sulfolobus tengchongensis]|uniref:Uncharacterized protein n=1 Tax=Sulfolobus tengchongensis TaxID=207809 RepID=A0AAX4L1P6_9CREN
MSCPPDKVIFDEERAERICAETGEVLEDRIAYTDSYYNNTYSELPPTKENFDREKRSKCISIEKLKQEILSHLNEKEKELFFNIIDRIKRIDVETLVAAYEYIKEKNGERTTTLRESLGLGSYAIRNKKRYIRAILRGYDPVLDYINSLPDRELALKVYEYLKKKNIVSGLGAKRRIQILNRYLKSKKKLESLLKEEEEERKREEISRTVLILTLLRF